MNWDDLTPEQKAEVFDRQHEYSADCAERKRENGEYPYDLDHLTGRPAGDGT